MRAGERGSISPTGDLIAFSIAIAIVLSLTWALRSMAPEEAGSDRLTPGTISFFLSWPVWDMDGDGVLEESSIEGTGANLTVPLDGSYLVNIEFSGKGYDFLFEHGRTMDMREVRIGITHSTAVLVASNGRTVPGSMSISEVHA
jgi:hypothetical protein